MTKQVLFLNRRFLYNGRLRNSTFFSSIGRLNELTHYNDLYVSNLAVFDSLRTTKSVNKRNGIRIKPSRLEQLFVTEKHKESTRQDHLEQERNPELPST
jgi:hypothetical protein